MAGYITNGYHNHCPVENGSNSQSPPVLSKVAILAATREGLREEGHTDGNGYIRFVNDCDPDRYLNVLEMDTPAARAVNCRHNHSTGP
jgi:hypothetical protein